MTDTGPVERGMPDPSGTSGQIVSDALSMMRNHLGMDAGVLSEFIGNWVEFRAVDTDPEGCVFRDQTRWSMDGSVCSSVLLGEVPSIITDVSKHAALRDSEMVQKLGIGAAIGLTIRRADGTPHGMLCFFSHHPKPELLKHDFGAVQMFAKLVEREVQRQVVAEAIKTADRDVIEGLIEARAFEIFAQPITVLKTLQVSGYEALCRFTGITDVPAETMFDFAGKVGLRAQLETTIIRAALEGTGDLPEGRYLSINAAPSTVSSPGFMDLFDGHDLDRVILEMTEHQEVGDYPLLLSLLEPLRAAGLRIAVDDAGTGYSGLHQIIQLQPDMIKLDRALVAGIDTDQAKRAMCAAMVHYAGESGAFLVAEGVETAAEADELIRLGVSHAQGFYFGRPLPLSMLKAA